MAKLYFKYGAMGSSKTAQALITKFNYEERGMDVWLLKPSVDCRDGETLLRSRIGLEATADVEPYADGFYLMTPFNRVALMERLIARLRTELLDAEG